MAANGERSSDQGAIRPSDVRGERERRSESRLTCSRMIDILPSTNPGKPWTLQRVEMIDCSPSGLAFISQIPLDVDEEFLIKFDGEKVLLVRCGVRSCAMIGSSRHRIGAIFLGMQGSTEKDPNFSLMKLLGN
jgi:hypothetical protein